MTDRWTVILDFNQMSDWRKKCDTCLGFHQLSVNLRKAIKEAFIQEELAFGGITGREEAKNSCPVLLVHGQDDADRRLSNPRRAVLQSGGAKLTKDGEYVWLKGVWRATIPYSCEKGPKFRVRWSDWNNEILTFLFVRCQFEKAKVLSIFSLCNLITALRHRNQQCENKGGGLKSSLYHRGDLLEELFHFLWRGNIFNHLTFWKVIDHFNF